MKKSLALVLSLIMIMTSVFIAPLSAQADDESDYILLPNGSVKYTIGRYDTQYLSFETTQPGKLIVSAYATMVSPESDSDGEFKLEIQEQAYSSGPKGYVNAKVDFYTVPGNHQLSIDSSGTPSDVEYTLTCQFIPSTQSFDINVDNYRNYRNLAKAIPVSLDTQYYGQFAGSYNTVGSYFTKDHSDAFSYKTNINAGDLYLSFFAENGSETFGDGRFYSNFIGLYDGDGNQIAYKSIKTVNSTVYRYFANLPAGEYYIHISIAVPGNYSFMLTQSNPIPEPPQPSQPTQPTSPTPTQPTQTTVPQISTKVTKPKKVTIKKVKGYKKALEVSYAKVSGVGGYQIQVATDKKFKKNKKTVTAKKSKTKVKINKLKGKKKYYVRIRAYKNVSGKKVYGSWSKVKTVKTK